MPSRVERPARPTGRDRRAEARRRAEEARAASDDDRRAMPTWTLVVAVAAVVAILVGVALATGFLTPPSSSGNSTTPAASVRVLARGDAADVAVIDGAAWVANDTAGTLQRVDLSSGRAFGHPVPVGQRPVAVAAGDGKLWVADAVGNDVVVVDPRTGKRVGGPISVATEPVSIAAGEGGIWVASLGADTVSLIDPRSRTVSATAALPDGAVRIAVGDGAAWVTGKTDSLTKISPKPFGVTLVAHDVRVGQGPIGVAVDSGAVWVANAQSGTVSRVDPATLRVTATFRVEQGAVNGQAGPSSAGSDPVAVAVFGGLVWVGDAQSGAVVAIDPATGAQHGAAVRPGGGPRRLVADSGALYATTANPGALVQLSPR
ncbi:MAG: Vgb family protein [Acidimicrobiales bacterium]